MTEPGIYLEKLSAFSRILRMEGLAVSTKENPRNSKGSGCQKGHRIQTDIN